MRLLAILAIGVIVSMISTNIASAAIDPTSASLEIQPGESYQQVVGIINDTSSTQLFSLELSAIEFGQSADDLRFVELDSARRSWFALNETTFSLASGARHDVSLNIVIPVGTSSQEFAFAMVAQVWPADVQGVSVASAYASLFFVSIGEGSLPQLQIEAFDSVPSNDHALPIRFAGLVTNVGDGLSQPEVGVVIKNPWGREIDHLSFNDLGRRVPAQTSRVFSGEWAGHPWRLGPYTAEFYVYPDESEMVLLSSLRVVLFPWQMLCIFATGIIILIAGIAIFKRARRQ